VHPLIAEMQSVMAETGVSSPQIAALFMLCARLDRIESALSERRAA
jgi:hypothetical protein